MKALSIIGGRKFLMSLIILGIGTAIELYTERGISANFVALLGVVLASFGVTNTIGKFSGGTPPSDEGSNGGGDLTEPLEQIMTQNEELKQALYNVQQTSANTGKLLSAVLSQPPQ